MIASALTLGLVGLAAASPVADRRVVPHYPGTSLSKGFRLVINVTDHCKDFHPPIQNTYISSIHTGAGLALVGNSADAEYARIFYQNGTAQEKRFGGITTISDSGTPPFPSGFKLVKDPGSETVSTAHLDGGLGSKGVGITAFPEPYAFLTPETYAACNESQPYYRGKYLIIIKQAQVTVDENGGIHRNIPEGCAPVRLLPECTQLNSLPKGSYSSHEFAIEDRCYKDVKSIKWSEYGP
ncbi:hypothetical protein TOPH_01542 [Tolypocladium ophioglossoides CBS 100239]|uniref:DUF7907 domain-containing protein n=1 Tax=Tolypocladium ophioglossoides (strain CBS 100239) TaxID=1163406 RepID=A0A0L0NIP9_TOLOC|nr:hypothetical protein TOPH_01542 [Tolypocladium ophioglossoides CBS 100239]